MVLKSNKNFWIDTDWGTATDILGTIIQTLVLATAIYAILQTTKSLKYSKKALDNNEKALENSQKALEISQSDNELLKKQLEFLYKPDFKFDFQDFMIELNKDTGDIRKGKSVNELGRELTSKMNTAIYDFYEFNVANTSDNDINEILIENFVYFNLEQLEKLNEEKIEKNISFVRSKYYSYLTKDEKLKFIFVRYVQQYISNFTILNNNDKPILFVSIEYKNKLEENEIEYYKFQMTIPSRTISFNPSKTIYKISWNYKKINKEIFMSYKKSLQKNVKTYNQTVSEGKYT